MYVHCVCMCVHVYMCWHVSAFYHPNIMHIDYLFCIICTYHILLIQLSAPLPVRMVVPVHHLECVPVLLIGLEFVVAIVSY